MSWTHYRILLRVEDRRAREWYMVEAASQNWGSQALERQIGTLYEDICITCFCCQEICPEKAMVLR